MQLSLRAIGLAGLLASLAMGGVACASIWGFRDLSGSADASAGDTDDDASVPPEAGGDGITDDASGAMTVDAAGGDAYAGDAGTPDAAVTDAGANDAATLSDAMRSCLAICSGCCDESGLCQPGTTVAACGKAGTLCQPCPASMGACVLPEYGPCCGSSQSCSCEPVTLCNTFQ